MELSGLGMELIHCLIRQFDLLLQDALQRSIPKLKGLSNMKGTSFPSGRNQFGDMQTKKQGVSIPCRVC